MPEPVPLFADCVICAATGSCADVAVGALIAIVLSGVPIEQVHRDLCRPHRALIDRTVSFVVSSRYDA